MNTIKELKTKAKRLGVLRYSKMTKAQLEEAFSDENINAENRKLTLHALRVEAQRRGITETSTVRRHQLEAALIRRMH